VATDGSSQVSESPELVSTTGTLKNLTVLIRFNDHAALPLPSNGDYDVLFNADGGHTTPAPTGSLKDVYHEISYDQLTINSTVTGWHTVSNNETYYTTDGENGGSELGQQAMREALDLADQTIDFNDFDEDGDGYVDSLAFIHSGYGAEWGGHPTRFWSHRWVFVQQIGGGLAYNDWVSDEGVKVRDYHISTGLWSTSGYDIGHIGVIAHETGHYLGLPDLYDSNGGGTGIGRWGLMGSSWGFNGQQYCPSHMSAWSKQQLGWTSPIVINGDGPYSLDQAETTSQVYRIDTGYRLYLFYPS
jgi:M6 family metalloprotease-like protein